MNSMMERASARPAVTVDVAVCTFRRDSLQRTLASLAAQTGLDDVRLRVVVADNDERPLIEPQIRAQARVLGLDLDYRHAPFRNISVARNACLDAAQGDWLAFIDDDQTVEPGWLAALLAEAQAGGWDAVLGPVRAVYDDAAPGWMRSGDLHSIRPVFRDGRIETGYTCNVLIRRRLIETAGLRFDPALGRTGGEDVDFFYGLTDAGGRIGFAADAWACEPVPAPRTRLRWLLTRAFRSGQTHGRRLSQGRTAFARRAGQFVLASAKAGVCAVAALAAAPRPATAGRFVTRGVLHLGVAARLAGLREIELY